MDTWNGPAMRRVAFGWLLVALAAGCSNGGRSGLPPGSSPGLVTPQSVSPGLIKAAPMAHTEILPRNRPRRLQKGW